MYQTFKKIFTSLVLLMVVFSTAGQGSGIAFAAEKTQPDLSAPLAPGFTWNDLGQTTRSIILNIKGDAISLSGETFQAADHFGAQLPEDILSFYSNEQLFNSAGWTSDNSFETPQGQTQIFYHESGVYLAIDFNACSDDASATCVTVWKSEQASKATIVPGTDQSVETVTPDTVTFGKSAPAKGATVSAISTIKLSWQAFSPTPDKYSYCVKAGSQCAANDPDWTGTYTNTSVNVTLQGGLTYYWQVKAITCMTCTPKKVVYANNSNWWTFTTVSNTISGSAGVAGATLTYVDSGTKTVVAGADGNYLINPSNNWTGTVTPSKTGYTFTPASIAYSNVKVAQVNQNYTANLIRYTITGSAGAAGVTMNYVDGIARTVLSDGTGAYSISVPYNWSGTVTPSKDCLTFQSASLVYSNVLSNKTNQNYTVTAYTPSITGNAGIGLATMSYTDGTPQTVPALVNGNYSVTVSCGWTGTITPSKAGMTFNPASHSYDSLVSNQINQNFIAQVSIGGNAGVGTTISYVDGGPKSVVADGSGNYTLDVSYNWSGTLIPSRATTIFSPKSLPLTNVTASLTGQNFVPSLGETLSGDVGIAGVALSFTDGSLQTVYSGSDGHYSLGVSANWSGTVTPSKTGYTFYPASRTYTTQAIDLTGQDYKIVQRGASTVGVFRPNQNKIYLRNSNTTGTPDITITAGQSGDYMVVGDWNGDGTDTPGIYHNGTFYLYNSTSGGAADVTFAFGVAGYLPVAGDWNGDGIDTIGVYRKSTHTFYLRDSNSAGAADITVVQGVTGDLPVTGDWDGNGTDTVGVYHPGTSTFFLKTANTTGSGVTKVKFGPSGSKPIVGDWNNDGTDTIGVLRSGTFYLRNSNTVGTADLTFYLDFAVIGLPVAGNWDGQP